jgi:hypothetical protein
VRRERGFPWSFGTVGEVEDLVKASYSGLYRFLANKWASAPHAQIFLGKMFRRKCLKAYDNTAEANHLSLGPELPFLAHCRSSGIVPYSQKGKKFDLKRKCKIASSEGIDRTENCFLVSTLLPVPLAKLKLLIINANRCRGDMGKV